MIRHAFQGLILVVLLLAPVPGTGAWGGTLPDHARNLHHSLTVTLDPSTRALFGVDEITFDGAGVFEIGLAPGFRVSRMALDGRVVNRREWRSGKLDVLNDGPHKLHITYSGKLAPIPATRGGRPPPMAVAGAEGAFLRSAMWYPLVAAKTFSYDLTLTVPAPYKAVAPGRIVSESLSDGRFTLRVETDRPTNEIVAFVAPYDISEITRAGVRVRTYFTPMLKGAETEYLELSAAYIDHYSKLIGPYPFTDFHVIAAPMGVGLGYRNLTYMSERVLRLPFIRYTSLPHEILHNWWGNGAQPDYARGNWAEGLTTYMADYAMSAQRGPAKAKEKRISWLRDYAALDPARDTTVSSFTGKTHTAAQIIGYNKVAFIFHMLRNRIGGDAFDAGLRAFWAANRFKTADWHVLQSAFEAASQTDLNPFFRQWLDRKGAPQLSLASVQSEPDAAGHAVTVTIEQSAPHYDLLVPITIATEQGFERVVMPISKIKTTKRFVVSARPMTVSVDPGFDVFRRLSVDETPPILRDVILASKAQVLLLGPATALATGRELATRMLDQPPRFMDDAKSIDENSPLLIIGTGPAAKSAIAGLGIPSDTAIPGQRNGTAQIWSHRDANGRPIVVVAAANQVALGNLLRPLPHYGRYSYLVFDGAKAVTKGTWELKSGPLTHRFN